MTKRRRSRFKVLLLNPSGWQNESVNLGLCCLAGTLDAAGYESLILDLTRYPMTDAELVARVRRFRPALIGVSVKTATAKEGARVAELLAGRCRKAKFVAGGPHVTLCAETYMTEHPVFDFGVLGEGEQSVVRLAKALAGRRSVKDMDGLAVRADGRVKINPWSPPADLNSLPYPDLDAIEGFNWADFRYPIVTSRGCPFRCTYCCVNKLTGSRRWRRRSPENVVDELEHVAREKGIRAFEIWDDNFTLNLKRAKEICRLLIDRKLNLSWYCHNGIRADHIDSELAELMARAGCTSVAFGIETGNPETFDSIKKGESLSTVINAVETVKHVGIKPVGYFIIGLPGDNLDRFIETVRFQRSLGLWHYVFGMLIPYPRTELWDMVQKQGKMLCEITETQHFSDDVVPVSFELPEFPQEDMIRAFHIARYFELYEVVQKAVARGHRTRVVYMSSPALLEHLPGLFIACGREVRHVVLFSYLDEKIRAIPSYEQVPEGTRIDFIDAPQAWQPDRGESCVIVGERHMLKRHLVLANADVVLFEPRTPLKFMTRLKKPITPSWIIRGRLLGVLGFFRSLPTLVRVFGVGLIVGVALSERYTGRWGGRILRLAGFVRRFFVGIWNVAVRVVRAPYGRVLRAAYTRVRRVPYGQILWATPGRILRALRVHSLLAAYRRVRRVPYGRVLRAIGRGVLSALRALPAAYRRVRRVPYGQILRAVYVRIRRSLRRFAKAAYSAINWLRGKSAAAKVRLKNRLRPYRNKLLRILNVAAFSHLKASLRVMKHRKRDLPFDDHPSHM